MLSSKYTSTVARLSFLGLAAISAFLLTAHYKLALPEDHPYGAPRVLGSQAWQLAFKAGSASTATAVSDAATNSSTSSSYEDDYFDDWEDNDLWGGFGKNEWDPLSTAHVTPLTEITVKSCVVPPGLFDVCSPTTSAKEDALRGVWKRVDRDLNRQIGGIYYLYVFYRRLLPGSSAPVITNLTILHHAPTSDDLSAGGTWVEVSESLRTGVYPRMAPAFLHYKLTPQADVFAARKMSSNASAGALEPITELDVIYGGKEVSPLFGYSKVQTMITGDEDDEKRASTGGNRAGSALAFRKGIEKIPRAPTSRFSAEGNFTILQVADLHFSVGPGECRDMDAKHEAACKQAGADAYSLQWLATALDEVKPDLVVLSGDQLNGQGTSWSSQSTIMKWAPILYSRGITWTTIFGNHDEEETDLGREAQVNLMKTLPYYVGEIGPNGVDGVGNYVRSIRANDTDTVLATLYFLDSHAYAKSLKPWGDKTYDSLKANQINWFRGRSSQVKTYKRPYTPTVRKGSRPSRPGRPHRPSKPKPKPTTSDYDDERNHLKARQAGDDEEEDEGEENEGFGTGAIGQEDDFDTIREELAEEQEEEAEAEAEEDGDFGIGNTMIDDDGSNVKDEDDGYVDFESLSSTSTSSGVSASATGSATEEADDEEYEEGEEQNELLKEEEYDLTPTLLEAGPTKASPMTAKPNALVFFHIPLQESYTAPIDVGADGKRLLVGDRYEGNGASKTNSGFFEQAILAQSERISSSGDGPIDEFWDGESGNPTEGRPEVKVVANGHCHITEDCRRIKGTWLCFGGGGSYSGYGKGGFSRRMRVYQLSEYGERIETYKLLDSLERIDRTVLVGEDALGQ